MRIGSPTFLAVALMHGVQAVILLLSSKANGCIAAWTMMFVAHYAFPAAASEVGIRLTVAVALLACVACCLVSVFMGQLRVVSRVALLLPQQALLVIVSGGIVAFVAVMSYADGVLRAREFITFDQVAVLAMLYAHSHSLLRLMYGR